MWARRPRRPSRRRRSKRPPPACPLEAIDASRGAIDAWSHQAACRCVEPSGCPLLHLEEQRRSTAATRGASRKGPRWPSMEEHLCVYIVLAVSCSIAAHGRARVISPSSAASLLLPLSTDHFLAFVCCCYAYAFCCSRMLSLLDRAYHYIQRVSFRCNLHTCAKLPCLFSDLT